MELNLWRKLIQIDKTVIFITPKELWDSEVSIGAFKDGSVYCIAFKLKYCKAMVWGVSGDIEEWERWIEYFNKMSRSEILEQLDPEVKELLKDPKYDLKWNPLEDVEI